MNVQTEKPEQVRMCCSQRAHQGRPGKLEWTGLNDSDFDALEAMLNRSAWVRITDGRIERTAVHTSPPPPTEDPLIPVKWQMPRNGRACKYDVMDQPEPKELGYSPSVIIQHLVGYGFTEERYKTEAGKLESYGFECLRSRRGDNGRYWEVWLLPSTSMAEGALKRCLHSRCNRCNGWTSPEQPIDSPDCPNANFRYHLNRDECGLGTMVKFDRFNHRDQTRMTINFLCDHVNFGTLDIMVQRAVMVID